MFFWVMYLTLFSGTIKIRGLRSSRAQEIQSQLSLETQLFIASWFFFYYLLIHYVLTIYYLCSFLCMIFSHCLLFVYDTLLGVMYNLPQSRHPPGQKELSMGCIYYIYTHTGPTSGYAEEENKTAQGP